jgi:hypothetical protein
VSHGHRREVENVEEMKELEGAEELEVENVEEVKVAALAKSASQQPDVQDPTRVDEMGA